MEYLRVRKLIVDQDLTKTRGLLTHIREELRGNDGFCSLSLLRQDSHITEYFLA